MANFVGIDLAWKATNRTGLAAVDDGGRLIASASVTSDDDIASWLAAAAPEPVVVAIDAPLVVPNETGQRVAENLISQAYGKFGASAYPANRSNPLFNPPRALVLADRFGWNIDPSTVTGNGTTVCIEVYPHPALVGLFELPQRILYKKGLDRRAGFSELASLLESVPELHLESSPQWLELTRTIAHPLPGDLNRIEDELDAILCAHLAWLWHHRHGDLMVYGGVDDGYIVAPPPPKHAAILTSPPTTPAVDEEWIMPPAPVALTGTEPFLGLDATVAEFWAYAVRDLRDNTTRGFLAEWLVAKAVGATELQPEWAAFDVVSPDGVKIEVKTGAYLQAWAQRRHSAIRFVNLKTRKWDPVTLEQSEPMFGADVYVFCVQTARDHEAYNALDVAQWDFYVLERAVLEELNQRSVGLAAIQARTGPVKFSELAAAIGAAGQSRLGA